MRDKREINNSVPNQTSTILRITEIFFSYVSAEILNVFQDFNINNFKCDTRYRIINVFYISIN